MNEIKSCEVCQNSGLSAVINLGSHPLCDDLIQIGSNRVSKEYPIEILHCDICNTCHQRFQVPKTELFPRTYHYRSKFTADVLTGMKNLVDDCEEKTQSLRDHLVVDVGCNDGSLLNFFREKNAVTIGIEPTDAADDAMSNGHTIYKEYFSPETSEALVKKHGHPKIICFTNVFAHIEDLASLLNAIDIMMGDQTILVIENHYLGAVIDRKQFDTFYHEHPRTYSLGSFERISKTLNCTIIDANFPSRYGGNIRVFLGKKPIFSDKNTKSLEAIRLSEKSFPQKLLNLGGQVDFWREKKRKEICSLVDTHGPIIAKGFPGRAAILLKILSLDANIIKAIYEKPGSMKIGHFAPGTRIKILSDNDLQLENLGDTPILNLAWHISSEITTYLRGRGFSGPVVDILTSGDFK